MFKKFLPKEELYFSNFISMIDIVADMGKISANFFSSEEYDTDMFTQLKPLEKQCDEIATKTIKKLDETFITPFDREDIFALVKKIEDISEILLSVTIRVNTYNVKKKVAGAGEIADIIYKQVLLLQQVLNKLEKNEHDHSQLEEIRSLESEADKIYRDSLKAMFYDENANANAIEIIKSKAVLDQLEKAADKCQACVNVIRSILIKNS
ncbi:MAG: DUF47 family protein [Bacteroidetes bacterium]|nr:DUF47 family protein [Bacteroidota bacterium]